MPTSEQAQELREAQDGLATLSTRDLLAIIAALNLSRPEQARDTLIAETINLVARYALIGATLAADFFDVARADAGVSGRFRAEPYVPDARERITQTVRRVATGLFIGRPDETFTGLAGPVSRYVSDAPRQTIMRASTEDTSAAGWQRVTAPGACAFCRMLAQRGAVYSRATVDFASHNHCNCAAVPSWDDDAPLADVRAYRASKKTKNMSPAQREAHRKQVREYLKDFDPDDTRYDVSPTRVRAGKQAQLRDYKAVIARDGGNDWMRDKVEVLEREIADLG